MIVCRVRTVEGPPTEPLRGEGVRVGDKGPGRVGPGLSRGQLRQGTVFRRADRLGCVITSRTK